MRRAISFLARASTVVLGTWASGCLLDSSAFDSGPGGPGPGAGGTGAQGGTTAGGGGAGAGTTTTPSTGGVGPGGSGGTAGTGGVGGTGGSGGIPDPNCGNGVKEGTEQCDDGLGNSDTGACLLNCRNATCGDGHKHLNFEECDDGPENSDTGACLVNCVLNYCGDGKVHEGVEDCEDGNRTEGDGCFQCKHDCGCPGCTVGTACNGCGLTGSSAGSVSYKPSGSKQCYVIDPTALTWAASRASCLAWDGDLAGLSTTGELTDVVRPEIAAVVDAGPNGRAWIGGNDLATEGTYVWSNGESFTYVKGTPPWEGSEPSPSDNCVVIGKAASGYTLRGNLCTELRPFLCEKTIP